MSVKFAGDAPKEMLHILNSAGVAFLSSIVIDTTSPLATVVFNGTFVVRYPLVVFNRPPFGFPRVPGLGFPRWRKFSFFSGSLLRGGDGFFFLG